MKKELDALKFDFFEIINSLFSINIYFIDSETSRSWVSYKDFQGLSYKIENGFLIITQSSDDKNQIYIFNINNIDLIETTSILQKFKNDKLDLFNCDDLIRISDNLYSKLGSIITCLKNEYNIKNIKEL